MNIILEGPDNCGKSTLALAIHNATGWPIKEKEGRPADWEGLLAKLRIYERIDGMIIDRHPILTQSVYGILRSDPDIPDEFMDRFIARNDLIIYCRALRSLEDHKPSPTDNQFHLQMIERHHDKILAIYDNVGINFANIVYTMYEQTDLVVAMVKGALTHERR